MNRNGAATAKTALVLSGGGAFGAYEVGVIQALYSGKSPVTKGSPLDAEVFAGTSVGNYNAAIMAMNQGGPRASAAHLHDIWTKHIADNDDGRGNGVYRIRGDVDNYFDPRIPGSPVEQVKRLLRDITTFTGYAARSTERFVSSHGDLIGRVTGLIDISIFLNTEPFAALIRETVNPEALRKSLTGGKSLTVTATNWGTGHPRDFHFTHLSNDGVWDAIRASAAIPGLFPPVSISGDIFVDGGVVMNTPIKPAIQAGADEIHVISLEPAVHDLGKVSTETTWDIMNRVLTTMVAENISEDIASAKWVNDGLEVLERIDAGVTPDSEDAQRFIRAIHMIRKRIESDGVLPRKLTIHRYYPKKPLGGMMGLLNFERAAIDTMIDQGYADTCSHNCAENGCVIPAVGGKADAAAA